MRKRMPYGNNNNNMRNNQGGGGGQNRNRNQQHRPMNQGSGRGGYEGDDLDQVNPRQRKHAQNMKEKYSNQGHDAMRNGDRVLAEYWFQHAEHYSRVLNAIDELYAPEARPQRQGNDGQDGEMHGGSDESHASGDEGQPQDGQRDSYSRPNNNYQGNRPRYQPRPQENGGDNQNRGESSQDRYERRPQQDRYPQQDRNQGQQRYQGQDRPQEQRGQDQARPEQARPDQARSDQPRREPYPPRGPRPEGNRQENRPPREAQPHIDPAAQHGSSLAGILPGVPVMPTPAAPVAAQPEFASAVPETAPKRRGRPPLKRDAAIDAAHSGFGPSTAEGGPVSDGPATAGSSFPSDSQND